MTLPAFMRVEPGAVLLSLKVQPRSSANEIGDALGEELRVKVTAPPVDAAANDALVKVLAKQIGCPKNHVELLRGHTSRHKVVRIHGVTAEAVVEKLGLPCKKHD